MCGLLFDLETLAHIIRRENLHNNTAITLLIIIM